MCLSKIIEQFDEKLTSCGLLADVRCFHSPSIRALCYQKQIAISMNATGEEARETLQLACRLATSPADVAMRLAQRLHLVHGIYTEPVVVWKPDSFSHPSTLQPRGDIHGRNHSNGRVHTGQQTGTKIRRAKFNGSGNEIK